MKTVLFLAVLFCLSASTQFIEIHTSSQKVEGTVVDEKGEAISFANVFLKGTKRGTQTDSLGYFAMMIPDGSQLLTISHPLYERKEVESSREPLRITLGPGKIAGVAIADKDSKSIRIRGYSSAGVKKKTPIPSSATSYSAVPESKAMPREAFSEEASAMDMVVEREVATSPRKEKKSGPKSEVGAGQLTAGEWNDLNNWEAWNTLVRATDYKEMEDYWNINAQDRISVFVVNQFELPIPDCVVKLTSKGRLIWTTKTDNAGKSELWAGPDLEDMTLEVISKNNRREIKRVKRIKDGVNRIAFKEECNAPTKAEIMFVVDATGSMGDEIEFLKSELKDVIDQVESSRSSINFKWGSVFYRDESDDYLTRQSPLSPKPKRVIDFISRQSAGGGGDYPEAVNSGLEEALMQEWSDEAIARIIFLVLDAPPHHDQDVLDELKSQIEFASTMGIKIIPITASGINRQTEYLMKFMSNMTNGTYVFLTDHSGIGNGHLDPIVKDFEVEKLNDLLVRLISNYTDPGNCKRQDDDNSVFAKVEVFPNPTLDVVQVKVPEGVEKITFTTSTGKLIHSEKILKQCDLSLDLSTYLDGMYIVNFFKGDERHSVKVIKVNKA